MWNETQWRRAKQASVRGFNVAAEPFPEAKCVCLCEDPTSCKGPSTYHEHKNSVRNITKQNLYG